MTFHKSAAKVVSRLEKNKPGDARIASRGKDPGLKILEERANEVQGKHSLKSRRSLSRKNSPAKELEPARVILDSPEAASTPIGSPMEST